MSEGVYICILEAGRDQNVDKIIQAVQDYRLQWVMHGDMIWHNICITGDAPDKIKFKRTAPTADRSPYQK